MKSVLLDHLNAASDRDFVAALEGIFEHAPWVAAAAASRRPFGSLAALRGALDDAMMGAGEEHQIVLVRNHPELAGRAALAQELTRESAGEQVLAGLDRLSEPELSRFRDLNHAYSERFGFPFILCVRRHSKASILDEFERRLTQDPAAERHTALEEIARIAALRLHERVSGPDTLPVMGRLSTHVLDTHAGLPARGLRIELFDVGGGEADLLLCATTNADGRTDAPLISGRPLPKGRYELRFHAGAYFAAHGLESTQPAFLDVVPVRFGIAEPEGNYHVPLLLTPWSYTTYRGS